MTVIYAKGIATETKKDREILFYIALTMTDKLFEKAWEQVKQLYDYHHARSKFIELTSEYRCCILIKRSRFDDKRSTRFSDGWEPSEVWS